MENKTITIRWARDKDRKAEHEIKRAAWESAYGHIFTPEEIRGVFEGELSFHADWLVYRKERIGSLVAVLEDLVVGTAGFAVLHDGDGEVAHLYVHPKHQRQGIGKQLWDRCAVELRKRGCKQIWVWSLDKADAVHFYEHIGCRYVERGELRVGEHRESVRGYCFALAVNA